jgi:hypothetical protein
MRRGRDKEESDRSVSREAAGGFCIVLLGGFMALGAVSVLLRLAEALAGEPAPGLWRTALIWLVAPGIGIAAVARLTFGDRLRGGWGRGHR